MIPILPRGLATFVQEIDRLLGRLYWTSVAVFAGVVLTMLFFAGRFRASRSIVVYTPGTTSRRMRSSGT